jgi:signal transduction histidine kinase
VSVEPSPSAAARPADPAAAVDRALGDRLTELVALNRLAIALSGTLDVDEIVDVSLQVAVGGLGFERGLILLVDRATDELADGRSFGSPELAAIVAAMRVSVDDPDALFAQLVRADGPLLFRDVDADPHEPNRAIATALGVRDFVGTPLVAHGRSIGILAVDDRRAGRSVDAGDGPVLFTVGNLVAGALESAQLYRELEAQNRALESRVVERTRDLVVAMSAAQDARAAAEAANAAKSTFLSNVSHELRTPLTSILGFAKLDRKRLDDVVFPVTPRDDPKVDRAVRQVSETLGIVVAEGERLTGLINDLLDLAKIEAGRLEFRREPVALDGVVRQAVAATSALYEVAGLPLEVAVREPIPPITGDHDRLVQVVINLLSNAEKFTREGRVSVSVQGAGGAVEVAVRDTGAGIRPEDQETVFEPFRQASDTLPDTPHGTGLGRPISREIVLAHGGRMWLESSPGTGSTFAFVIPVAAEA